MKKCVKGLEVKVLKSNAGYYIGTTKEDEEFCCEMPNCRLSSYYKDEKTAQKELEEKKFIEREAPENVWCSGGWGSCLK